MFARLLLRIVLFSRKAGPALGFLCFLGLMSAATAGSGTAPAGSGSSTTGPGLSPAASGLSPGRPAALGAELGWPLFRFSVADTVEIVARRIRPLGGAPVPRPSAYLGMDSSATTLQIRRSRAFSSLTRFRMYNRPLAMRALYGADRFAGTAAAVGGLGLVGGLWDGRTAGWLVGAGALLGTIWGGTIGADNPSIRIGVDPRSTDPFERRERPLLR